MAYLIKRNYYVGLTKLGRIRNAETMFQIYYHKVECFISYLIYMYLRTSLAREQAPFKAFLNILSIQKPFLNLFGLISFFLVIYPNSGKTIINFYHAHLPHWTFLFF